MSTAPSTVKSQKELEIRARVQQILTETGEARRLEESLKTSLIDCGWRDNVKAHCREIIKRAGSENITVEQLIDQVTPKAKSTIPEDIKADLLKQIRESLTKSLQQPSA